MSFSLLAAVTFLAVALTVAGIYSIVSDLFLRDRIRVSQRMEEEFSPARLGRSAKSALFKDLGKIAKEAASAEGVARSVRRRFEEMVEQSGLGLTPARVLTYAGTCAVVVAGLVALLSRNVPAGLAVGLAGATGPVLYVRAKRNKRQQRLLAQLPDALDLMARSVRAGQTMSQALQAVADEFDAPIGPEFAFCYEQQNLGLPPEIAYQDLARRTGILEFKIFVLAMNVQRQTGGNLAELLSNLAGVVRDRFRIKGRIRVLTAEGRVQAIVLLAMPPVVFVLMMFVNHDYTVVLLDHPKALALMGLSMGLGALWIRKIVNFEF